MTLPRTFFTFGHDHVLVSRPAAATLGAACGIHARARERAHGVQLRKRHGGQRLQLLPAAGSFIAAVSVGYGYEWFGGVERDEVDAHFLLRAETKYDIGGARLVLKGTSYETTKRVSK